MRGLAREMAVAFDLPSPTRPREVPPSGRERLAGAHRGPARLRPVRVRRVSGIDPAAEPFWLRRRLQLAGIRSISLAVDVTNYVMLELGPADARLRRHEAGW